MNTYNNEQQSREKQKGATFIKYFDVELNKKTIETVLYNYSSTYTPKFISFKKSNEGL